MSIKNKYVEVIWDDHNSLIGKVWFTREEAKDAATPDRITSVGIVVCETPDILTLTLSAPHDGTTVMKPFNILKKCIVKRRVLK